VRPRDTNQLMVDILTGEVEDRERTPEERGVDPAASTAANGNTVVVVDQKQTEHLAPIMVGYLDRRLGVSSPWVGLNPDA
jgi:hypothetical protein